MALPKNKKTDVPVVPIATTDAPTPDAPASTLPTTDANLNANNAPDAPKPDEPKKPTIDELKLQGKTYSEIVALGYKHEDVEKIVPPTDNEILSDLTQKWNEAEDAYAEARKKNVAFDELRKLKMTAHKAFDAINAHNNAVAAKTAQVETERKLNEYLGIIPQLFEAYEQNKSVLDELAKIPVGERSPEQIANANNYTETYNKLLAETNERLKTAFGKSKTIVFAPQGMTGKQLEKQTGASTNGSKSKTDELFELMDAGKTYDELIAAGYADGTIRSAAWKGSYSKNSNGSYTKKPKS